MSNRSVDTAKVERWARQRPLISLMALDASFFDKDGTALHLAMLKDGKDELERILTEATRDKSLRQALLDSGTRRLGTPAVSMVRAFPDLLTPASANRSGVDAFYGRVGAGLRAGRVLLYGEAEALVLVDAALVEDFPPSPEEYQVVAGVVPGRYACFMRRDPRLREFLGAGEEEFGRALVFDLGGVGDRVRVLERTDDEAGTEERVEEALAHLHGHFDISLSRMWEVFGHSPLRPWRGAHASPGPEAAQPHLRHRPGRAQ